MWRIKYENWEKGGGKLAGLPPPQEPERPQRGPMPFWLSVYLECKRWNALLCEGGLWDQPDWSWDLADLAGMVFAAERHSG